MKFHEYANIFPMMEQVEIARLAEDIKDKGQAEPVVIFEDKILDGRNRWRACEMIDIRPVVIEYTGNDPLGFVVSHNLHRRHMNEAQRGMVAAKIADLPKGAPKGNQNASLKSNGPNGPFVSDDKTIAKAAAMMNVSPRTVKRAKRVINSGIPELQDMVTSGEVNVTVAEKVSQLPTQKQRQAVEGGAESVRAAAKAPPVTAAPTRRPPIKVIEHEGERIWILAKGHLDRINKHDVHRVKVLNECISYCMNRLKANK